MLDGRRTVIRGPCFRVRIPEPPGHSGSPRLSWRSLYGFSPSQSFWIIHKGTSSPNLQC